MGAARVALVAPIVTPLRRWRQSRRQPRQRRPRRSAVPVSLRATATVGPDALVTLDQYAELWVLASTPMNRLEQTYLRAQRFLTGPDRYLCQALITSAVDAGADVARTTRADGDPDIAAVEQLLDARAVDAEEFLERRAERDARRRYTLGLLMGVLSTLVLLTVVGRLTEPVVESLTGANGLDRAEYWSLRDTLACLGGGALGAVLSVLLAMRNRRMDYETVTRGAAAFRIVLGWLFAAALLFLIKGGTLTLFEDPTGPLIAGSPPGAEAIEVRSFFFWAGLGFIAGFNERWVRNLIIRTDSSAEEGGNAKFPHPRQNPE
ncbi:MAG: hypothetical protein L0Y54_11225 [Sporichthyaceae bacterium]|nr:hypothetical protein [Sporichthyaceae bacterium]